MNHAFCLDIAVIYNGEVLKDAILTFSHENLLNYLQHLRMHERDITTASIAMLMCQYIGRYTYCNRILIQLRLAGYRT